MKNENELRELDAWIAEHVFGYKLERGVFEYDGSTTHWTVWVDSQGNKYNPKKFTTDPAAAMLVLEKCCELTVVVVSAMASENWHVSQINGSRIQSEAPTLPLAICLFAKELFK